MPTKEERALAKFGRWAEEKQRVETAEAEAERALTDVTVKVDVLHQMVDGIPVQAAGTPVELERRAKKVIAVGEVLDRAIAKAEALVAA